MFSKLQVVAGKRLSFQKKKPTPSCMGTYKASQQGTKVKPEEPPAVGRR
jgi:hypothetical protein